MTGGFQLFAQPWWVNLLLLAPIAMAWRWRRRPLEIAGMTLIWAALFAAAFGFVEGAVVVYLRAASGMLPGYHGSLADVIREADVVRQSAGSYQQSHAPAEVPQSLLVIEVIREAATIVMLGTVAMLSARRGRERWGMFLWCFAIWDASYYGALWATVRWPYSLTAPDVLFLIPAPWLAQVWYPLLVSGLMMLAVVTGRRGSPELVAAERAETAAA